MLSRPVEELNSRRNRLIDLLKHTSNLERSILVSATYDGEKKTAVLKFYSPETHSIKLWYDNTGHRPYCYTKAPVADLQMLQDRADIVSVTEEKRMDLLKDQEIKLTKIVAADPLAIGGSVGDKSVRNIVECWEADIKYYENFLYDLGLHTGSFCGIKDSKIEPVTFEVPKHIMESFGDLQRKDPELTSKMIEWARLLSQPLPNLKRSSLDIEVSSTEESRIPNPQEAQYQVVAAGMAGSDGLAEVLLLRRSGADSDPALDDGVKATVFNDEKALMGAVFDRILDYPFIVTFNGDDFDLSYLYHRALRLGFSKDEIPINLGKEVAFLKHGVHLDLYKTFNNKSLQVYAFGGKYVEHTLNGVSAALLGVSKLEFDGPLSALPLKELARYCFRDAQITYDLTHFSGDLLVKLLLVVARIAKMPIDDVARLGVSNWIRSLMFFEHRRINALIPRPEDLESKGGASSQAIIKGKKYKGGIVVEPTAGVYFNVSVVDFSSLYPSIIKVQNLSYETVDCVHAECKASIIPGTSHWKCVKKRGLTSLVIGSLRDLRVNYYKPLARNPSLSREEKDLYTVVSQALKVILNASYGVMGAEMYPLYCLPVADATAAVGRYIITHTIERCKQLGITVIYGDTDSLFLQSPTETQLQEITGWAQAELEVDLDLDRNYRYVAFSQRKKNYLGILEDGSFEIKGLTGKKSHVPPFIKKTFYESVEILSRVRSKGEFEAAREEIKKSIRSKVSALKGKKIPLEELAFNVMMGKPPERYVDSIPQHVRAAQLLRQRNGKEVKAGDIISYVKTTTPSGVKPVSLASLEEVDVGKYLDHLRSTFDQLLDALGYDFDEILGATKLEDFFWGS